MLRHKSLTINDIAQYIGGGGGILVVVFEVLYWENISTRVEVMDERIKNIKTPDGCEKFSKNAIRLGHPELAIEAQRRAIELRAEGHSVQTDAEKEALKAIYAYEEILTEKNGRRTRANRTWQMINRRGIIEAVNRVVARKDDAIGYILLKKKGMEDLSFEAVVLRYPQIFSEKAVSHAEERISKHD